LRKPPKDSRRVVKYAGALKTVRNYFGVMLCVFAQAQKRRRGGQSSSKAAF